MMRDAVISPMAPARVSRRLLGVIVLSALIAVPASAHAARVRHEHGAAGRQARPSGEHGSSRAPRSRLAGRAARPSGRETERPSVSIRAAPSRSRRQGAQRAPLTARKLDGRLGVRRISSPAHRKPGGSSSRVAGRSKRLNHATARGAHVPISSAHRPRSVVRASRSGRVADRPAPVNVPIPRAHEASVAPSARPASPVSQPLRLSNAYPVAGDAAALLLSMLAAALVIGFLLADGLGLGPRHHAWRRRWIRRPPWTS
jgi:hypothetical protein